LVITISKICFETLRYATIGFFFETLGMQLKPRMSCVYDGQDFCSTDEYTLRFYVNDEKKYNISQYVISEDGRILVSYGPESQQNTI